MRKLFDTDGIRGKANSYPMTPEMALRIGKAAALVFRNSEKRHKILIGKDTRLSGYIFETALTSGLCSMGVDVLLVGPMPTPAIAHLTKSLGADASIVISASHNPSEDNGIKFFSKDGFKLPDSVELEIEKHIFSKEISAEHISAEKIGKAFRIDDAVGRYIEFAKATISNLDLSNLKIIVDCANGAAFKVGPTIFKELGAKVIAIHDQPDGLNINLNCGSLHLESLKKKVIEEKADLGIAFDGDCDRVILVDEQGKETDGDYILALSALEMKRDGALKKNTVVGTVMANLGFKAAMKENGINFVETRVGDRYVIEEMAKNGYNLGGEQSGHLIFLDHNTTGDGIVSSLQVLSILANRREPLSKLKGIMKKFPQVLLNLEVKKKKDFNKMKKAYEKIIEVEQKLGKKGRVLVRYSGTQNIARVMIEGENQEEITNYAEEIASEIEKEVGK